MKYQFWAKNDEIPHPQFYKIDVDPAVCPAVPGFARQCPAVRLRPSAIQALYSRAGAQEGTRWQSTTPSNYYYYYYYYYYYLLPTTYYLLPTTYYPLYTTIYIYIYIYITI